MEVNQIKERLRSSLEMQVLWRNLVIVTVVVIPFMLICLIGNIDHLDLVWPYVLFTACVMILPGLIFCIVRTVQIYRKPEAYIFCRGVLAQLHSSVFWRTFYYTVVLEDPQDGSKFFVDTRAIFASHGIISPTIEEYNNSTVTIAYNRETETVVVIG